MPRPDSRPSSIASRRPATISSAAVDLDLFGIAKTLDSHASTRMNAAPLSSALPRSEIARKRSSSNNTMSGKKIEDERRRCDGEKGKAGDESPEIEIRSWIEKKADDEECMILDGDPDKPVSFESDSASAVDEDHELLILGAKGQSACRDFPHARHLCGSFNFATTPHQKHCLQCYCYVCDSIAPCREWGTGRNLFDHCNATSESLSFRNERKLKVRRLKKELGIR